MQQATDVLVIEKAGKGIIGKTCDLALRRSVPVVSMGFSAFRLSLLPPSTSWGPKAAFRSMSDRRPALSDLGGLQNGVLM